MKDEKIKKGIKEIKKIEMTYDEKRLVFQNLLDLIGEKEIVRPDLNHGLFYSFLFASTKRRLVYYVLIPLIIIFSSGGVAFASQDSLPGDFLYPIKTKIIEPVQSVLSFSSESKTRHESNLVSKRLVEAETLVKEGRLNKENGEKINKLIEKHTTALGRSIEKIDEKDSDKKIDETMEKLNKEIDTRIKNIDEIKNKNKEKINTKEENKKEKEEIAKQEGEDPEVDKEDSKKPENKNKKESTQKKNR